MIRLCDLNIGEEARVIYINGDSERLMDLGFTMGATVVPLMRAPALVHKENAMTAYSVRSTAIALRREESERIMVEII